MNFLPRPLKAGKKIIIFWSWSEKTPKDYFQKFINNLIMIFTHICSSWSPLCNEKSGSWFQGSYVKLWMFYHGRSKLWNKIIRFWNQSEQTSKAYLWKSIKLLIIIFTHIEVLEALSATKEEARDSGTPTSSYDFPGYRRATLKNWARSNCGLTSKQHLYQSTKSLALIFYMCCISLSRLSHGIWISWFRYSYSDLSIFYDRRAKLRNRHIRSKINFIN